MSAFERLFYGDTDESEIIRNLGVVPTHDVIRHINQKLFKFGEHGVQGFDMAVKTYKIMRGDDVHLRFHKNVDGELEEFLFPFTFPTATDSKDNDRGLLNGYTYGINILSRTLPNVELVQPTEDGVKSYEATENLRIIAKDNSSNNYLIAKSTQKIPDQVIDFGYSEMPRNIASISGYLVLPKPEAISLVLNQPISSYLV